VAEPPDHPLRKAGEFSADCQQLVRVDDDLRQPNGIIGTPDGKTLYVADIGEGKTYRFDIASDGHHAPKRLVCEQGSDGMTLDSEGNLYLTGNGVLVFNKKGWPFQPLSMGKFCPRTIPPFRMVAVSPTDGSLKDGALSPVTSEKASSLSSLGGPPDSSRSAGADSPVRPVEITDSSVWALGVWHGT
jgi:hypothetical protein